MEFVEILGCPLRSSPYKEWSKPLSREIDGSAQDQRRQRRQQKVPRQRCLRAGAADAAVTRTARSLRLPPLGAMRETPTRKARLLRGSAPRAVDTAGLGSVQLGLPKTTTA